MMKKRYQSGETNGNGSADLIGTWKKLLGYCQKYMVWIVLALLCSIAGTVLTLMGPDKLSNMTDCITDGLLTGIDMDRIFTIGIQLVIMYAAGFILTATQGWTMANITQRVTKQMRSDISKKINRLPMSFYNKTSTGDVLSCVTNDVDTIGQSLNQSLGNFVHAIVLFAGSLVMMLKTNGIMTLSAVTASLLGFVFMFLIMGRSQKYFTRQQSCLGKLNGHIEEIFAGHTVVKAYNGEENSGKVFDEMNQKPMKVVCGHKAWPVLCSPSWDLSETLVMLRCVLSAVPWFLMIRSVSV
jgi:ATP-binding cassette subfamily B protein